MAESTDKIICSICLNDFKQPKLIDCNHAFCLTCLEDYINRVSTNNRFPCPLCRHYVTVPEGGVGEFPANLDKAELPVYEMEIPPRDACKNGVHSKFRCENCQKHLCSSCKGIHDSSEVCRDHVVANVDNATVDTSSDNTDPLSTDVCPNHHERKARCYCKDCSIPVCSDCFITSHLLHKFVDFQDKGIVDQFREDLRCLKEGLRGRISEFEQYCESIGKVIEDIDNSAKTSCEAVDKQVERICCEAKELGEEFKVQIETSRAEETQKLTQILGEMKILIDELKASVKYSVDILQDKSIAQVIKRIPQVQDEKDESGLRKLDMPDVKYACFEDGVIDKTILSKHLGTVEIQEESSFTSSFSLADLKHQKGKGVYGTVYHISGHGWYLWVRKQKEGDNSTLGVDLYWRMTHDTNCSVQVKCTLINKTDGQSITFNTNQTFNQQTPNWDVPSFLDWKKLTDAGYGFLDQNNNFRIKATVNVTKVGATFDDGDEDEFYTDGLIPYSYYEDILPTNDEFTPCLLDENILSSYCPLRCIVDDDFIPYPYDEDRLLSEDEFIFNSDGTT